MTVRVFEPQREIDSTRLEMLDRRRRSSTVSAPAVIRVPLVPVGERPLNERPGACAHCGSKGFNVHQRTWRTVRDPHLKRVNVARFVCKRCGATCRLYPTGIGPERQSEAIKQICAMLYCMGLTYRNVQQVLQHIGCPLSMTTIRQDVLQACAVEQTMRPFDRLHLTVDEPGRLSGPDGALVIRLIGSLPARRWLELEVTERVGGAELEWRAQVCARQFSASGSATGN
ncbi:MAG: transposase family protein [Chloroflexota bacterium]